MRVGALFLTAGIGARHRQRDPALPTIWTFSSMTLAAVRRHKRYATICAPRTTVGTGAFSYMSQRGRRRSFRLLTLQSGAPLRTNLSVCGASAKHEGVRKTVVPNFRHHLCNSWKRALHARIEFEAGGGGELR